MQARIKATHGQAGARRLVFWVQISPGPLPSLHRMLWHTIGIYINRFRHVYPVATTTIQLSKEIKRTLESMKLHTRETYDAVLVRIMEDLREMSEQTTK